MHAILNFKPFRRPSPLSSTRLAGIRQAVADGQSVPLLLTTDAIYDRLVERCWTRLIFGRCSHADELKLFGFSLKRARKEIGRKAGLRTTPPFKSSGRGALDVAKPSSPRLIVGIGASAGGLEAFKTFFGNMPVENGMAFVLVQHLAPEHKSLLAELIGRTTTMKVVEAEDATAVAANSVYVIPPDATLTVKNALLHVTKPAPAREHRRPIDTFFTSLAEDQGEKAVCIVLSGTGSDGAIGLAAVKEHGGLTLAQAGSNHAAMSGMPHNAAATGLVDHILPVEEMPAKLVEYQRHLLMVASLKEHDGTRTDAVTHLATITSLLRNKTGHDFSQYKEKTLVRRVQRRMQVLQVDSVLLYVSRLKEEPREIELLFRELLIGVTQFFRDRDAFGALRATVIPMLLENKDVNDPVRVWVPACATGQEVFSIAILLKEEIERQRAAFKVQIFGTDIDDYAVAAARAARYRKPLIGLSPEQVKRWFTEEEGDVYCPIKAIREMCVFSIHSVIKDAPFSKLDLVSCRNLLIYFNADLQDRVIRTFHYALRQRGVLFLGPSESVTRNETHFTPLEKKHGIFQRTDVAMARPSIEPLAPEVSTLEQSMSRIVPSGDDRLDRHVRHVLEKYSPAYVVINRRNEIVRFSGGEIGLYIAPSAGTATLNLFDNLRRPLRTTVRTAVQAAFSGKEPVVLHDIALTIAGTDRTVTVIVAPVAKVGAEAGLYIVAFQDTSLFSPRREEKSGEKTALNVKSIEQELQATKLQLQAALTEYEIVNEEMKSANKEYQLVNEELQSSNEELETAKEEMQSINEELQTINSEMISKNDILTRLNSDLRNLFESTEIATIFLDIDLCIKSFTPGMKDIFHLREVDRGRPITEIATLLSYGDLRRDVERVLCHGSVIENEVQTADCTATFIMRIRPYRAVNDAIDGVVITFVDITERRKADDARRESEAKFQAIADNIPILCWMANAEGWTYWYNRRWYEYTGTTAEAQEGWGWESVHDPRMLPAVVDHWKNSLATGQPFEMVVSLKGADGAFRRFLTRIVPLRNNENAIVNWFGTSTDISGQGNVEQGLRED